MCAIRRRRQWRVFQGSGTRGSAEIRPDPGIRRRLPVIATLEDLDEPALVTILTQPKNALVKQNQRLFELEDVKTKFTDDALKAIASAAIARKTGARGLRSIMEDILLDTMFDLPSTSGVEEVVGERGGRGPRTRIRYDLSERRRKSRPARADPRTPRPTRS